jgi:hypothetical protein
MAKTNYTNYDYLLLTVVILLIASAVILWKYDTFREISIVFFLLLIVALILFRYYDE